MKILLRLFTILCLLVFTLVQPVAALRQNDRDCVVAGGTGGTCFYDTTESCGSTGSGGGPISGDLKSLAQQILDNNDISYDGGPSGPTATQFKHLADGQQAETDDGRKVDVQPIILVTILHIAQGHKVNISALTDGDSHTAATNPHGSGKAVDINILDGSHTNGSDATADKIVKSAAEVLPDGSRFGLGSTPLGTKQVGGKSFGVFPDNPNHVHIDVKGVTQTANNAAVEAAGGGSAGSPADASASAAPATASQLDLNAIAQKYHLQSVTVKKIGGPVIDSYHADQPPAAAAFVLKVLIADVFLHTNPTLSQSVRIQPREIYSPGDATAGQSITLSTVLKRTLSEESWDTGANVLIDAAGGLSAVTASAHRLGYTSTDIVTYYHDPPAGQNKTTITDLTKAMEDVFTDTANNFAVARRALQGENHFDLNPAPYASKWGGTSKVAGNSAVYKIGSDKDIITLYVNGPHSKSPPSAAYTNVQKATEEIVNQLGGASGGASINTGSETSGCCADNGGVSLSGNTPAHKAFNYFMQQGASDKVAAGIVGNMMRETAGNTEKLDTHAFYNVGNGYYGLVQWDSGRWAALKAHEHGDPYDLANQLDYVWYELTHSDKPALNAMKAASDAAGAAAAFDELYERSSGSTRTDREANATVIFGKYGGGGSSASRLVANSGSSCGPESPTDSDIKTTNTVSTHGKFITLPQRYSCPGRTTVIDSRIAADVAYFVDHYHMCALDGLADGHKSHGAGVAVDMIPKNGTSKQDWKNSVEAAAKAMGWFGDGANDPKGSVPGCATYAPGAYGRCMHEVYVDRFPQWLRWLGYNGDYQHGDPWHIYGGAFAHIHIGWDTPNHDGAAPSKISTPRPTVYTFPAPIPDDLKNLVD